MPSWFPQMQTLPRAPPAALFTGALQCGFQLGHSAPLVEDITGHANLQEG